MAFVLLDTHMRSYEYEVLFFPNGYKFFYAIDNTELPIGSWRELCCTILLTAIRASRFSYTPTDKVSGAFNSVNITLFTNDMACATDLR